mgnify:CR=1 FL=1
MFQNIEKISNQKKNKEHRSKPPQGGLEVTPQLMRSETKKGERQNDNTRQTKKTN